ncbi:MAG: radical SAM protein [Kiritimatiellaeota bacterium]|nr:radical SAM protein [Kiritimatiellota bacterium]
MRYLFGPVLSRRYGTSLGVDLSLPPKTCTLNCRFCQLGDPPLSRLTVTRTDSPPIADVLDELRCWLPEAPPVDFITASGSGEPTLHARFGDLFRFVRAERGGYKSLLLTNGTLLPLPEVRREAALADVVKISLHAWDQESFERTVRPHPSLRLDAILDGYRAFRNEFAGRLDLEVFIMPGVNDSLEQARRIAALARSFSPDSISLNTAVRPTADPGITACPPGRLADLKEIFEGGGTAVSVSRSQPPPPDNLSPEERAALALRHPTKIG